MQFNAEARNSHSHRARCLSAVQIQGRWLSGREVAELAGLEYMQALYALNALLDQGKIARRGSKRGTMWGSLAVAEPPEGNFQLLMTLFFGGA